jgi:hypothetical protein
LTVSLNLSLSNRKALSKRPQGEQAGSPTEGRIRPMRIKPAGSYNGVAREQQHNVAQDGQLVEDSGSAHLAI